MLPKKLQQKLEKREQENALRVLPETNDLIDFASNDYLGFAKNITVSDQAFSILKDHGITASGATGSRLLSGNHILYVKAETFLTGFHQSESALIFNSGYDANIGFLSSVPQRGDLVLYDELIHASIRDGIKMGLAKSYKFKHNDIADLEKRCQVERIQNKEATIYIVTESVFSMDGDTPDLKAIVDIAKKYNSLLIVDEAHAVGVFGGGLIQNLGLQKDVFARIITFGKALGCHGAAILGSVDLKNYLVNFARSLIYTTGLPPHSLATILSAYQKLNVTLDKADKLHQNINYFNNQLKELKLGSHFIPSTSAIHCAVVPINERIKALAAKLRKSGFDIKAILSPTVPKGQERIRICLHSFNTEKEIDQLLNTLKNSF